MTSTSSTIAKSGHHEANAAGLGAGERRAVMVWLLVVLALLGFMVVLGGVTRLTESGLSITRWQPVTGVLPPLSEAQWQAEFELYRQIPQYQQVNAGMSLEAFKRIFWYEWAHRLLGRIIGLVFFIPLLAFTLRRRLDPPLLRRLWVIFALGGLQGFMGWFMVASGLTERVSVSQYRLAMHLGLAFVIVGAILWVLLDFLPARKPVVLPAERGRRVARWSAVLAGLILLQVLSGAIVAGIDAGLIYQTWPLMDGALIPDGLFTAGAWWLDPFENHLTVQFDHRMLAYAILAGSLAYALGPARALPQGSRARALATALPVAVTLQAALGVATLWTGVDIAVAATHQAGALVVFGLGIALAHDTRNVVLAHERGVDPGNAPA